MAMDNSLPKMAHFSALLRFPSIWDCSDAVCFEWWRFKLWAQDMISKQNTSNTVYKTTDVRSIFSSPDFFYLVLASINQEKKHLSTST